MGYVTQDHQTGRYRLGYRILDLSHAMTKGMGFRQTVYPHMKQLADEFVETVYYGVPDNGDVVYLDAAYPGHEYATRAMLGDRAKLYCTGIGKAILSWMSTEERDAALHFPLTAFTTQTLIDREALYCELDLARQRGYAVDNMEHEHGVKCVGAAVLNQRKQPVAAISLSGPSLRFDEERVAQIGARLVETVERMRLYF